MVPGLTAGTVYRVQNQSARCPARALPATTTPDVHDGGRLIPRRSDTRISESTIELAAGESLYVWSTKGSGSVWIDAAP